MERSAPVPAKEVTMGNTQPSGSGQLIHARDIGVRRGEVRRRWIIRHVDLKVIGGELVYVETDRRQRRRQVDLCEGRPGLDRDR